MKLGQGIVYKFMFVGLPDSNMTVSCLKCIGNSNIVEHLRSTDSTNESTSTCVILTIKNNNILHLI